MLDFILLNTDLSLETIMTRSDSTVLVI